MFRSFFPNPRVFFPSVLVWTALCMAAWYGFFRIDEPVRAELSYFWSKSFIAFYAFYAMTTAIFYLIWSRISDNKWMLWSIPGSALIIFSTYFSVQVSVVINEWYGGYYDMIQKALSGSGDVTLPDLYGGLLDFAGIAFVAVFVWALTVFFTSHWVFRWRTAMNEFYAENWEKLRGIEGASQRIQEDTMRFARETETLGVNFVKSIMTLIAFLPVLFVLSEHVKELPFIGAIPYSLVVAAIVWSLIGTGLLIFAGIRLPGLEFKIQKVEAAYRKELVYGEDNHERAKPASLQELFSHVRAKYFTIYGHYLYFNVFRVVYMQADIIFGVFVLAPTIAAGVITLGLMQQILNVFDQVRTSFQYLVESWPKIVDLLSVYKRLRQFEEKL